MNPLPKHFKARYRRLALVCRESHLERLDLDDAETLIVCCDWLLWQKTVAANRHCVHYELGIFDWTEPDAIDADLLVRSNDWFYRDGQDVTRFRGVSLGAAFGGEMCWCLISIIRIEKSLDKLFERFRPEEILFFDYFNDINVLSRPLRKRLVEALAGEYGVTMIDCTDGEAVGDSVIIEKLSAPPEHGLWARAALYLYAGALEMASRIRALFSDREKRVLVLVNTNLASTLVQNFSGGLTPIFIGRTVPKRLPLLLHCLRRGILLAKFGEPRLTSEDVERIEVIRESLEQAFATPENLRQEIVFAHARESVLRPAKLAEMATLVKSVENLVERYKPARIIVDGVRGGRGRIASEVASSRGIPVDYIWHSPLTPRSRPYDSLGGDPRVTPPVTRNLTWGKVNEAWLDNIEALQPQVRVGSPVNDRYRMTKTVSSNGGRNVLLLQYTHNSSDLRAVSDNMYRHFISCVRLLRQQGYSNIRFKLHPGPDKWKKSYFEDVARHFGLDCHILKFEPFDECLAWADIIIGPVQTGAFFEVLATGKPYYGFLMPPHSMSPEYYSGYPILSSVKQLADVLRQRPEEQAAKLLDDVCSASQFPSSSKRFWEVLGNDFA